jgi:hypothetical protein
MATIDELLKLDGVAAAKADFNKLSAVLVGSS